jgi:uncharacterized protein (DUF952 family)
MIFHICSKADWEVAERAGVYQENTSAPQEFIHCSTPDQIANVANSTFRGETGLVLLVIDESRVDSEIRYEGGGDGNPYPHIYGPLKVDAVVRVTDLVPQANGMFQLPDLTS